MRKNELFHVHALLVEVARRLHADGRLADDDLAEYRTVGVTPMDPQAPRAGHAAAVRTLAATLAAVVEHVDDREAVDIGSA